MEFVALDVHIYTQNIIAGVVVSTRGPRVSQKLSAVAALSRCGTKPNACAGAELVDNGEGERSSRQNGDDDIVAGCTKRGSKDQKTRCVLEVAETRRFAIKCIRRGWSAERQGGVVGDEVGQSRQKIPYNTQRFQTKHPSEASSTKLPTACCLCIFV